MTSLKLFKLFFHQLGSTIKPKTICHLLTAHQSLLWCDEDEDDESDGGGDEDTDNIIIFNCRCRDYPLANAATTANAVTPAQVCLPQELCECRGGGGWVPAVQEQDKLRHLLLPPHGGLGGPALGQPGQAHQRGPKRPI